MTLDASKLHGKAPFLRIHSSIIIGVLEHYVSQWRERGGSSGRIVSPGWRDAVLKFVCWQPWLLPKWSAPARWLRGCWICCPTGSPSSSGAGPAGPPGWSCQDFDGLAVDVAFRYRVHPLLEGAQYLPKKSPFPLVKSLVLRVFCFNFSWNNCTNSHQIALTPIFVGSTTIYLG